MRYVTARLLAVAVLGGLVAAAPAQPIPPTEPRLPEAPGTVSAREWLNQLLDHLQSLRQSILEDVPGARGRELYKRASILLEQARSLQQMVRSDAARDRLQYDVPRQDQRALQDRVADLDRQMHALVQELGELATDKATPLQRAAERANYSEQHLHEALTRGLDKTLPVSRQAELLAEEARQFSHAAAEAIHGNMDVRRLADDAKLFAAEADHFREMLNLEDVPEPSRRDFARVSAGWDQVQLDLRLVPRVGNQPLFDRAARISRLYERLAGHLGIVR
jgi:hypothetical protein